VSCGAPAGPAGNCAVTIVRPTALPAGECLELNSVVVNQSCPVGFNTSLPVRFDLTAQTARSALRWRRSVASSDVLQPSSGNVASRGPTSVLLSDLVLDSTLTIEIVDGEQVLLAFTLRHY
jgi:hypothetical protein